MADDLRVNVGVPDVGDIVEYKGERYRVDSWLRERLAPPKPKLTDQTSLKGLYEDILYESQQEIHGKKLRWCYQEEATYLSLAGVGGTVAPVDEVKVIGKVNWKPEHIEEARQQALRMAEEGDVLY